MYDCPPGCRVNFNKYVVVVVDYKAVVLYSNAKYMLVILILMACFRLAFYFKGCIAALKMVLLISLFVTSSTNLPTAHNGPGDKRESFNEHFTLFGSVDSSS